MVLGFATVAFAVHDEAVIIEEGSAVAQPGTAFVFGGDARVRGIQLNNYDLNKDTDEGDVKYWDQRARFTIDAKTTGGVELRTRMTLGNYGGNHVWYDEGKDNTADNEHVKTINWDWAYLHFPIGPVTIDVGNQRANWGYKFFVWDAPVDRLKVSGKFGNVSVAIGTDKLAEASGENLEEGTGEQVGGDYDKYFAVVGTKVADWNLKALYASYQDKRPATDETDCLDSVGGFACEDPGADENGAVLDLFVDGKAGPVGVHVEYVTKSGELFTAPNDDKSPNGAYIAVDGTFGQISAFAAYAFTKNGYVADNDFTPTLFYGTLQPTAVMNFGQDPFGGTADTGAIVIGGFYSVNEQITLGARYANAQLEEFNQATDDKGTISEFDLQADYAITKNLKYTLAYGNMKGSGDLFDAAEDPSASCILSMVNMKF